MLNKNPEQRLSISQVLIHPWLNHTNLIETQRHTILRYIEKQNAWKRFNSVTDKILYLEKEKEYFDPNQPIEIPIDFTQKVRDPCSKLMQGTSCQKKRKTVTILPRTLRKSKSTPTTAIQFPKRKSMI